MAKVAQQMVEQAGVNVKELLDKTSPGSIGRVYNLLLLHDSAGQRHWLGGERTQRNNRGCPPGTYPTTSGTGSSASTVGQGDRRDIH